MARIIMPLIVVFVLLLGTTAIVGLFVAGRTPPGMPVVPSGELTAASDRIAVVREAFDGAIAGTGAGGTLVRLRTRIESNHRLVDIGLARIAVRASEADREPWRRLRRSGEPVDVVIELAGQDPAGRAGDDPLAVRLEPIPGGGRTFDLAGHVVRLEGDRLRIDGLLAAVDVPVTGPGRWIVLLNADGSLVAVERAPGDEPAASSRPG